MPDPKWEDGYQHGVEDQTGRVEGTPRAAEMNYDVEDPEEHEARAETRRGEEKAERLSRQGAEGESSDEQE